MHSALVVAMGAGLIKTRAQEAFPLPAIDPPGTKAPIATPATSATPTAEQPGKQQTAPKAAPTAADAQKQEIANQCADLLQLATELKKAVDKSNADTLSVTVVRKASDIEQLAHKVRIANGKS
jgi:type VI protein secretion system component VasF